MALMSASLFEPAFQSPLQATVNWLTGTLLGSVAIGISVIAVALIGFTMLSGRLPLRRGVQVIIGCFVLIGAPAIAAGFAGFWQGAPHSAPPPLQVSAELAEPREELPPAQYDPYAGASLRSD